MLEPLKARTPGKKVPARKKFFYLIIGILLLATVITTFFGKKGFLDIQRQKKIYLELQAQIKDLTQKKQKLEAEIKELEVNPRAIEKEAREKLWLIKPEEKVVIRGKR
jgi:cell division protein FtsB